MTPWSILITDPRMVRKVVESLSDQGVSAYAPMEVFERKVSTRRAYQPGTRWVRTARPLLGAYVFALLDTDEALDTARGNKAVREVMCRDGRPVRIPALVVGSLALLEGLHTFDETWTPPKLKRKTVKRGGRRRKYREQPFEANEGLKITAGPFEGFTGLFLRAAREDRITVLVTLFGRVSEVEVGANDVEQVEKAA